MITEGLSITEMPDSIRLTKAFALDNAKQLELNEFKLFINKKK